MIIRMRKRGVLGDDRVESYANIDNFVVKKDILNPAKEHISLYFRGEDTSGIINLGMKEVQTIIDSVSKGQKVINNISMANFKDEIMGDIGVMKKNKIKGRKGQQKV